MGESVANGFFGTWRELGVKKRGMSWGVSSPSATHKFLNLTQPRMLALGASAKIAVDLAAWIATMSTAEATWASGQPAASMEQVFQSAKQDY